MAEVSLITKVLMFYRPPKPLNEYVVLGSTSTIHADGHFAGFEYVCELLAGKLCSLVSTVDGLFKGFKAKIRIKRVLETLQDKTLRLYQSITATRRVKKTGEIEGQDCLART